MTLPTHRLSLTTLALLAAALLLSACRNESVQRDNTLAATVQEASSWDTLPQSDALRAAEQTYRACAREAAQLHLAVQDFPEVVDRVTYLTQDGRRVRKTVQISIDIDDMHIDNGCTTHVVKSVSIDIVADKTQATSIDESGNTLAHRDDAQTSPAGAARVQLAISRQSQPAPVCTLRRDPGPQSHFMMLNLCRNEERRAGNWQERLEQPEESITRPKKNDIPATSS